MVGMSTETVKDGGHWETKGMPSVDAAGRQTPRRQEGVSTGDSG